MSKRRIFIGDLQGCREEFEALLEKVNFDPAADVLHPVGDLVNRGPDSMGCLRLARDLGAKPVLGNHDIHLLRQWKNASWRGKRKTLEEILGCDDGEELLGWLKKQPIIRAWNDVICVHAGLHPKWKNPVKKASNVDPLDAYDEIVEFAVRVRYCNPEGAFPKGGEFPPPPAPFEPWDAFWRRRPNETRTVVFGHWARRGLVELERTRGLDTGCVYGGFLTAWIPEDDRIMGVPARRVWYETA
ncbi:Bis(5'-nucleosyl)-tetraphosphatase [symmetrical] [Planctomycetes bacterium Poly30]|uniref:Bis(5'-nucleosyl)-tetraphosphatase [symmetrical] n=1 Tax=Saltatorellus ferox TaxID=2528018 RepID=A0A518EVD8_9BACT|nr:Bis(5'-nucleosyl)-tetraphosphatase [symmetrical] [Planctomycetes bacterium Poly30]